LQIKTKNVSCHTADSQPVKQEANGTVILPPLVFRDEVVDWNSRQKKRETKAKQLLRFKLYWLSNRYQRWNSPVFLRTS